MKGNIIYKPKGKAGEYAEWAANIYVGCPHDCTYCYCKRGVLSAVMGGKTPRLKSGFDTSEHAAIQFKKELDKYGDEIVEGGNSLFFSFSTDPMVKEERETTYECVRYAVNNDVPVTILTKAVDWIDEEKWTGLIYSNQRYFTIGVTLTGCDDMEPGAPSNMERIELLRKLSERFPDIRTFASVEPVIDIQCSMHMIEKSIKWCDEYKIGLLSGGALGYTKEDVEEFVEWVEVETGDSPIKVTWKKSVTDFIGKEK